MWLVEKRRIDGWMDGWVGRWVDDVMHRVGGTQGAVASVHLNLVLLQTLSRSNSACLRNVGTFLVGVSSFFGDVRSIYVPQ